MPKHSTANNRIIGSWMDDVELEIQRPSIPTGSPRRDALSLLVGKDSQTSPQTRKRSGRSAGQLDFNSKPFKCPHSVYAQDIDDSTQKIPIPVHRETRSRLGAGISSQDAPQNNSQSAYTTSLNEERSSALRLTAVTTLTHTSSYASQSSRPSSPHPRRARSRSPAKKVADLSTAVPPTYYFQLGANHKELPGHLRNLHRDITGAGKRGVLPSCLKAELMPYLDEFDANNEDLFGDGIMGTAKEERILLQHILKLHRKAQACYEQDKPEASWGEEVIRPLLNLSLANTKLPLDVICENVTSNKISPPNLIPAGTGISTLPFEAKKVDYCLFLDPNDSAAAQVRLRLRRLPSASAAKSINQCNATYVRSKVQIASVELKKALSSTDPLLQLAIWNSALFAQLAMLRRSEGDGEAMMAVPSLSIAGHRWELCYTYLQGVEEDSLEQSRIMLGSVEFGSTMDVLGIYRIMRRIKAIASYGVKEYWPWFQRHILWVEDTVPVDP